MILLDTSFLIRALVRRSPQDAKLRAWLAAGEEIGISVIALTEFLCGPLEPQQAELVVRIVAHRIAFAEQDAATAARLFNLTGRRRGSLIDCMIAATAMRVDAPLATENPADFRRFEPAGLTVIVA